MSNDRRYTTQFKTEAITHLVAAGYPTKRGALTQVSRQLAVPDTTLSAWFRNPPLLTYQPIPLPGEPPPSQDASPAAPPSLQPADILAFFQEEMALIRAELPAARRAASYKDLITALRGLNEDTQKMHNQQKEMTYDDADLTARLLAAMDQFAPFDEAAALAGESAAPVPDPTAL